MVIIFYIVILNFLPEVYHHSFPHHLEISILHLNLIIISNSFKLQVAKEKLYSLLFVNSLPVTTETKEAAQQHTVKKRKKGKQHKKNIIK